MTAPINQAEAITNLQRYLRRIGFKNSGGNTVPIDGIFDSATREALMDFQRSAGLSPTELPIRRPGMPFSANTAPLLRINGRGRDFIFFLTLQRDTECLQVTR